MAIVQSTAIGAGRNSAGELTYRRIRGRTIASRRVISNNSKTRPQQLQRSAFATVQKISKLLSPWINETFPQTKTGSARNNFVKSNNALLQVFKKDPSIVQGASSLFTAFREAISILQEKGKTVMAGQGSANVSYLVEKQTSFSYQVICSRPIMPGDNIRVLLAFAYQMQDFPGSTFDLTRVLNYAVTPEKISAMNDPYHLQISEEDLPELANLEGLLPPGSSIVDGITAVSISQQKELSNSVFMPFLGIPRIILNDFFQEALGSGYFNVVGRASPAYASTYVELEGLKVDTTSGEFEILKSVYDGAETCVLSFLTTLPTSPETYIEKEGIDPEPVEVIKDGQIIAIIINFPLVKVKD